MAILLAVIIAAAFGLAPVEVVAFTGPSPWWPSGADAAGRRPALDWNVLFILAGSVGLGVIVVQSGIATKISDLMTTLASGNALVVVVVVAVFTAVLTNLTTNAAAASISRRWRSKSPATWISRR